MKHFIDKTILCVILIWLGSSHITFSQCNQINYTDFETDLGVWIDGGIHAYRLNAKSYEGNMSVRLRANNGLGSSIYTSTLDFSNQQFPELSFYYYPESMERGEELIVEASYDGGNNFNQLASYASGTDFSNDVWTKATVDLRVMGQQAAILRIRCQASSTTDRVYIDNISIQDCGTDVIANVEEDEESACSVGSSCDDQNPCTENDVIDSNCQCTGVTVDSDNDSVCDFYDACPGGNDRIDLNQNGIPDACEETNSDCFMISQVDFENTNGIWNDGGIGAYLYRGRSSNGSKSFRLRGNGVATSSIYTNVLNLSETIDPKIQFQYYPESMEPGEQLIVETSIDAGNSFSPIVTLASGVDFSNYSWQSISIPLKGMGLSASMVIRIRVAGSSFLDKVYVDEIIIDDCPLGGPIASACLINTPCDDLDPCTDNDLWTASCDCVGTVMDSDNDGVCDIDDACPGNDDSIDSNSNGIPDGCELSGECLTIDQANFESGFGSWTDGGSHATLSIAQSKSGRLSIQLIGNSYSESAITSSRFDLKSTIKPELTFQYYTVDFAAGDKVDVYVTYDDGESYFPLTNLSYGADFANGMWNTATVPLDVYGLESNMSFQIMSSAMGTSRSVYIDDPLIQDCSPGLSDVISSACAIGTPCNDGDECTINDAYLEDCQCVGVVADFDADGICDAKDVCPNGDDTLDNDSNGVPDACESQLANCQTISFSDFESDFGIWNSGGNNARMYQYRGYNSSTSIRLTDNNGAASSIYSDIQDLSTARTPGLEFYYFPLSMEAGEELLIELSNDGGESYSIIKRFVSGIDFTTPQWERVSLSLSAYSPSAQTVIRLRCNASSTADKVYIDDLSILDCSNAETRQLTIEEDKSELVDIRVFPNPTTDYVRVRTANNTKDLNEKIQIDLFSTDGQLLQHTEINAGTEEVKLDMTRYTSKQLYFIRIIKNGQVVHHEALLKM